MLFYQGVREMDVTLRQLKAASIALQLTPGFPSGPFRHLLFMSRSWPQGLAASGLSPARAGTVPHSKKVGTLVWPAWSRAAADELT